MKKPDQARFGPARLTKWTGLNLSFSARPILRWAELGYALARQARPDEQPCPKKDLLIRLVFQQVKRDFTKK